MQTFKMRVQDRQTVQSVVSVPSAAAAASFAIQSVNQEYPIHLLGHRVVHGGVHFGSSRMVDEEVKNAIAGLADLAPLHNPPALDASWLSSGDCRECRKWLFSTLLFLPICLRASTYTRSHTNGMPALASAGLVFTASATFIVHKETGELLSQNKNNAGNGISFQNR